MQRRRCCVSFSSIRKLCGHTSVCSSVPGFCSPNFLRLLAARERVGQVRFMDC